MQKARQAQGFTGPVQAPLHAQTRQRTVCHSPLWRAASTPFAQLVNICSSIFFLCLFDSIVSFVCYGFVRFPEMFLCLFLSWKNAWFLCTCWLIDWLATGDTGPVCASEWRRMQRLPRQLPMRTKRLPRRVRRRKRRLATAAHLCVRRPSFGWALFCFATMEKVGVVCCRKEWRAKKFTVLCVRFAVLCVCVGSSIETNSCQVSRVETLANLRFWYERWSGRRRWSRFCYDGAFYGRCFA